MTALTRRSVIAGLAAFAASPALAQVTAFSSVAVDASHLRFTGQGPAADLVEAAMTDELRRVFADRIGGRGPRLVVRVRQLYLTGFPGPGVRNAGASDSMDGEALIVGPRGEILAAYPLFTTLAAYGSTRDAPENEPRRVVAIARNYAQWLRRKIS